MLTRQQSNRLRQLLEEYHEAWSNFMQDVVNDAVTRHGAEAHVIDLRERIIKYIREDLS